jgi:excisionase family DNA binding protein
MATKAKPKPPAANGPLLPAETVMTPAEVAAFLRVPEAAVLDLVHAGQLPARMIGNEWRLLKEAVVDWLRRPDLVPEGKKKSMLSVVGAFKDDDTLGPMVEEIYRRRKHDPVGG